MLQPRAAEGARAHAGGMDTDAAADAACLASVGPGHMFKFSLTVAGVLHICHNAVEHICLQLSWWESFQAGMQAVQRMFSNPSMNE
eukprot:767593-Lingulodinium_polyedra.AAC.1